MMHPTGNPRTAAQNTPLRAARDRLPSRVVTLRAIHAWDDFDSASANVRASSRERLGPSHEIISGEAWRSLHIEKHQKLTTLRGQIFLSEGCDQVFGIRFCISVSLRLLTVNISRLPGYGQHSYPVLS